MKVSALILVLVLVVTPAFSKSLKTDIDSSDEKKYEMAVTFLKSYDEDFSIVNWKVKVKKNKVIMSKYGSLERLSLYNHYFIKELSKEEEQS